ncbi:hypothetical protein AB0G73_27110 [Streptomyces sp. NPDC020719]|uniref:effector-associated constant component EACC1 n=1 Tax=unclassified Streptomyces TaxID=2593676 RepID=UPI0033C76A82
MSKIEIRVSGAADPEAELRSLLRWLHVDEAVGHAVHGTLGSSAPADPEHMGTLLDVMSLVVSGGLSAGQLALAVDQWRTARRASPRVLVRRGAVEIEIDGADPATIARITALLAGEEHSGDGGSA